MLHQIDLDNRFGLSASAIQRSPTVLHNNHGVSWHGPFFSLFLSLSLSRKKKRNPRKREATLRRTRDDGDWHGRKQCRCNPAFSGQAYYKDSFGEDSKRVKSLFERASDLGIPVVRVSLTPADLKLLVLSETVVAIALVNKAILLREQNLDAWQNQPRPDFGAIPMEPLR